VAQLAAEARPLTRRCRKALPLRCLPADSAGLRAENLPRSPQATCAGRVRSGLEKGAPWALVASPLDGMARMASRQSEQEQHGSVAAVDGRGMASRRQLGAQAGAPSPRTAWQGSAVSRLAPVLCRGARRWERPASSRPLNRSCDSTGPDSQALAITVPIHSAPLCRGHRLPHHSCGPYEVLRRSGLARSP